MKQVILVATVFAAIALGIALNEPDIKPQTPQAQTNSSIEVMPVKPNVRLQPADVDMQSDVQTNNHLNNLTMVN